MTYFGEVDLDLDLDLRSNFQIDLSMSCHASFKPPLREEYDGGTFISISLLVNRQ